MAKSVWYLYLDEQQEGPYTPLELAMDSRVTLKTLVRREGTNIWQPLEEWEELSEIARKYKGKGGNKAKGKKTQEEPSALIGDEIILEASKEPPPLLTLLILLLLLLSISLYYLLNR